MLRRELAEVEDLRDDINKQALDFFEQVVPLSTLYLDSRLTCSNGVRNIKQVAPPLIDRIKKLKRLLRVQPNHRQTTGELTCSIRQRGERQWQRDAMAAANEQATGMSSGVKMAHMPPAAAGVTGNLQLAKQHREELMRIEYNPESRNQPHNTFPPLTYSPSGGTGRSPSHGCKSSGRLAPRTPCPDAKVGALGRRRLHRLERTALALVCEHQMKALPSLRDPYAAPVQTALL